MEKQRWNAALGAFNVASTSGDFEAYCRTANCAATVVPPETIILKLSE